MINASDKTAEMIPSGALNGGGGISCRRRNIGNAIIVVAYTNRRVIVAIATAVKNDD